MIDRARQYGEGPSQPVGKPLTEREGDKTDFEIKGTMVDLQISNANGKKTITIPTIEYVLLLKATIDTMKKEAKKTDFRITRAERIVQQQDRMIKDLTKQLAGKLDKMR